METSYRASKRHDHNFIYTVQAFCDKVSHRIWVSFADFKPVLVLIEEGLLQVMAFLSVFHQQDITINFTAQYGIDGEERMGVADGPGNYFSDNYHNLFWYEYTGFHIWVTLMQTLFVGYSKPGASGFWDQAGTFY